MSRLKSVDVLIWHWTQDSHVDKSLVNEQDMRVILGSIMDVND